MQSFGSFNIWIHQLSIKSIACIISNNILKATILFKVFTNWNKNFASEYLKTRCYKITCYDPKDEIISVLGSLQIGVLKEILLERVNYQLEEEISTYPQGMKLVIHAVKNSVLKKHLNIKNEKNADAAYKNYFEMHYLSKNDFNLLFNALSRVIEVIIEMSKHKATGKKMHKRYLSSDDAQLDKIKRESNLKTSSSGNSGSLDSSLNVSINVSQFKDDDVIPIERSINDQSIVLNNTQDIISGGKIEENLNEESLKNLELKVWGEEQNYLELLTDKEKNSTNFQNFILDVFSCLDSVDAGGISLTDFFLNYPKNKKELFQVLNLIYIFY